jgi:hypothetical protein
MVPANFDRDDGVTRANLGQMTIGVFSENGVVIRNLF